MEKIKVTIDTEGMLGFEMLEGLKGEVSCEARTKSIVSIFGGVEKDSGTTPDYFESEGEEKFNELENRFK